MTSDEDEPKLTSEEEVEAVNLTDEDEEQHFQTLQNEGVESEEDYQYDQSYEPEYEDM